MLLIMLTGQPKQIFVKTGTVSQKETLGAEDYCMCHSPGVYKSIAIYIRQTFLSACKTPKLDSFTLMLEHCDCWFTHIKNGRNKL